MIKSKSDKKIATVTKKGILTVKKEGTITVTQQFNNWGNWEDSTEKTISLDKPLTKLY